MNKSPFHHDSFRDAECQKYARLLGAYVDGELDAPKMLEIEGHVERCEMCRERIELDRAMRGTLKKVVHEAAGAGRTDQAADKGAMRARMLAAMNGERARVETRKAAESADMRGKLLGWRTLVPLSSAAALAIVWSSVSHAPMHANGINGAGSVNADMNVKTAGLSNDLVAGFSQIHSGNWPMERTDPQSVRALEQYVGVPVRPATFEKKGAHLVGGRLMPMRDERAALLEYRIGQGPSAQRVSVFIYDPRKIQVGNADLQPLAVGTAQVRVGRANGYSVAVTQRNGIGYALASDLDTEHSAELAALADQD